jgi:serine/threonine protein kinase
MFGDYELLQEVARGGMGLVYKARQLSLNRVVALKMILEGLLESEDIIGRFLTEARAAAGLDHPNIVPVYEAGAHDGRHYFTMAFVEGTTLSKLVEAQGVRSPAEAATLVQTIAWAVEYAHRRNVIHRDLKPANVLIDEQGRPRVTDFGMAKCLNEGGGHTVPGQVLGTPAFMAPEQALGCNEEVGPAADIYALGGLLYFLLTGRPPFTGNSVPQVLHRAAHEPPVAPREHRPEVPAGLEAVCLRCLDKDPGQRFASAADLAAALEPWVVRAAPAASTLIFPRPKTTRWWLWASLATLAAGLLLCGWWMASGGWREPTRHPLPDTHQQQDPGPPPPLAIEATHHDFGLQVEMVGFAPDAQGERRLVAGQKIQFQIRVEKNAYVGIWDIDPQGHITQLFPNREEPENLIPAGKPHLVPHPNKKYEIEVEPATAPERVWIVASTRRWDSLESERDGPFLVFKTSQQRQEWQRRMRSLRLRPSDKGEAAQVSEVVLHYRVVPAGQP